MLSNTVRGFSKHYVKALRQETLSANVKECQYAVRGAIPMRGEVIKKDFREGKKDDYNFEKVIPCNIGNP
jgi:alanine transaminase